MSGLKLSFENARAERLVAWLERPAGDIRAFALFAHCFTCSKDLKAAFSISKALVAEGIAVLRFDFTGLGESEGDFAETNFSSNVADLLAAAAFLEAEFQAPQLLIGHSLGGAAVLMAARHLPSVKAVVTFGAPADPQHVTHLLKAADADLSSRGEAELVIAGRSFRVKQQFLDDLASVCLPETLGHLHKALMVMHAPLDNVVSVDNARKIFEAAKHPKSFVSLDHADHLLSDRRDAHYVGQVIAAWVGRYLPEGSSWRDEVASDAIVVRTGKTYYTEVVAKGFRLIADEPVHHGGTNLGPNPYDYLSVALAACKALTLRMYADRKALPVDAIEVGIKHSKQPKADDLSETPKKQDHFAVTIAIEGAIDETSRARMLEISGRCPVHRTLESDSVIEACLAD